jgi:hypothetical protein
MDISLSNVTELTIHKAELPQRTYLTLIIKYGDGLVQEIVLTGNEYDPLPIVFE